MRQMQQKFPSIQFWIWGPSGLSGLGAAVLEKWFEAATVGSRPEDSMCPPQLLPSTGQLSHQAEQAAKSEHLRVPPTTHWHLGLGAVL